MKRAQNRFLDLMSVTMIIFIFLAGSVIAQDIAGPGKRGIKKKIIKRGLKKSIDLDGIAGNDDLDGADLTDLLLDFTSSDEVKVQAKENIDQGGDDFTNLRAGSRFYSVYQSSMLKKVISSTIPKGQTGIQKRILNPKDREFFYISPTERTTKAGIYFKSRINDIIMGRRIAIDIEEATADGADILSTQETRIGQRASNDELGIYMLVPIGWRQDKSSAAVFRYYYLSITETSAYKSLTMPDKRKKLIEATVDEQEYIELYIDFIPKKDMETREISLLRTNELLHSEFQGGIKDFDTVAFHNTWEGWKSVIRGFKKSGQNMICYTTVFRPKVFDEEKREKVIFLKFLFLESRQIKYHVLYDAIVKSVYWADAVGY